MELMNAKQTAEYLQLSYSHFMLLKQKNPDSLPPSIKLGTKTNRWDKASVDNWLKEKQLEQLKGGK